MWGVATLYLRLLPDGFFSDPMNAVSHSLRSVDSSCLTPPATVNVVARKEATAHAASTQGHLLPVTLPFITSPLNESPNFDSGSFLLHLIKRNPRLISLRHTEIRADRLTSPLPGSST